MDHDIIRKLGLEREVVICQACLDRAKGGDTWEITNTLNQILELARFSDQTQVKCSENIGKICEILNILIKTQDDSLNKECSDLICAENDHNSVKLGGSPLDFIKSSNRNRVLVQTLKSFSKLSDIHLENGPTKKIERLSLSYETLLSTRNLRVVTLPSLSKNLKLVKQTHNKSLVNEVFLPSVL